MGLATRGEMVASGRTKSSSSDSVFSLSLRRKNQGAGIVEEGA